MDVLRRIEHWVAAHLRRVYYVACYNLAVLNGAIYAPPRSASPVGRASEEWTAWRLAMDGRLRSSWLQLGRDKLMKRKQLKFVVGSGVIILTLAFLAYSGYQESSAYFNTVPELYAMADKAYDVRLQVSGDVVPGSRKYEGRVVDFVIADPAKPDQTLKVKYVGTDPLPDTFVDRATAIVTGHYNRDGVFVANHMTAKCASKYEKEAAAGVYLTDKKEKE